VIHILIPLHSSVGTGYHRTVLPVPLYNTGCRFCRSPCKKDQQWRNQLKSLPNIALSQRAYRNSACPEKLTIHRLLLKSLPNARELAEYRLSRRAGRIPKMLTIYRLFPKSLQNVNINQRARRISALAEELVEYRVGPYPNTMRNIDHTCARIYRPSFRENNPRKLVFRHRKRAFWACFHDNWDYNFGHGRACRKSSLPKELAGHQKYIRTGLDLLHFRMVPAHQPVKQGEQTTVILRLQSKGAKKITVSCSVVDQDPDWIRIQWDPWIRIRIRNPDPDPGGKKCPTNIEKN
jgi:hypothetical protein